MNKHHEFFSVLSVAFVLLAAALLIPTIMGIEGHAGFMASLTDIAGQ
jgi:hypothetical protein